MTESPASAVVDGLSDHEPSSVIVDVLPSAARRDKAIGWKAQLRLHARYRKLLGRGKCPQHVVTAVGRELLGFIWAIGVTVGRQQRKTSSSIAA